MNVKSLLRVEMAKNNINSITELANLTGISRITLSSYTSEAIVNATLKNLLKISTVLKCNIQDLFTIT